MNNLNGFSTQNLIYTGYAKALSKNKGADSQDLQKNQSCALEIYSLGMVKRQFTVFNYFTNILCPHFYICQIWFSTFLSFGREIQWHICIRILKLMNPGSNWINTACKLLLYIGIKTELHLFYLYQTLQNRYQFYIFSLQRHLRDYFLESRSCSVTIAIHCKVVV